MQTPRALMAAYDVMVLQIARMDRTKLTAVSINIRGVYGKYVDKFNRMRIKYTIRQM